MKQKSIIFLFIIILTTIVFATNSGVPPVKMNDIQEGMMVVKNEEQPGFFDVLPKLDTHVTVDIEGMVATATVDQMFTNPDSEPIEAIYVFPLPANAAVHDMKMIVDDRIIQGIVQEKQEAKKTYEKAKKEGKRTSLTEQKRPNIFTNSVANIMPGDTLIVRLQYVEQLDYEDGTFSLRFPMVVGPRYISGKTLKGFSETGFAQNTDIVPDASEITPPVLPLGMRGGNDLFLHINLDVGLPLDKIESISHEIESSVNPDGSYAVKLKNGETIPNKDFVLDYTIATGNEPKAALFTSKKDGENYFMLMAVPPVDASEVEVASKEIIFVVDKSGSMSGTSMEQAKQSLKNALKKLTSKDYFNIVSFSDWNEEFRNKPIQATTSNVYAGLNWVGQLVANGGTEAQPALKHAMNMPHEKGTLRMIVFITDGCVGNETQLFQLVENNIADARLFTVSIGSAPNSFLLEKISKHGRGTFTYISSVSEVTEKMDGLFSKIEKPVLTDLALNLKGQAELIPNRLPDLFEKQPLFVFGKIKDDKPISASFTGKIASGIFNLELPIDINNSSHHPAISTLWAREKIADLMDDYRLGNTNVKQDVIDIAVEHHLLTKFTSFVAVEEKIVNPLGKLLAKAIPAELPEGWDYSKIFGGAQSAELAKPADDVPSGADTKIKPAEYTPGYLPKTATNNSLWAFIGLLLMVFSGVSIIMLKQIIK